MELTTYFGPLTSDPTGESLMQVQGIRAILVIVDSLAVIVDSIPGEQAWKSFYRIFYRFCLFFTQELPNCFFSQIDAIRLASQLHQRLRRISFL